MSVQVGAGVQEDIKPQLPFVLSEVVGEACRAFATGEIASTYRGINLLPKNKLAHMAIRKKRWWLAAAAGIIALAPTPGIFVALENLSEAETARVRLDRLVEQKWNEVNDQEEKHEELLALDEIALAMKKDLQPLKDVSAGADNWRHLFGELQKCIFDKTLGEIWLDELYVERKDLTGTKSDRRRSNPKVARTATRQLVINGRFLVREIPKGGENAPEDEPETPEPDPLPDDQDNRRDLLIQLNSSRQTALTESLEQCVFVEEILKKQFQTEGKGDLFNRFYTYFHYEIRLKGRRQL